ncbi:WD repeat-containing protein 6 [Cephus cinctus]|uniref:tRNA (34-2'-O)-methyltransferase regulator WDR6 n=1 Tax=Cephus cinctus TaxID=211228 RepID=A0AAJ7BRA5_CEPCN|nr:WD repeat-containing protein 6 [Cephus cinctus]
MISKFISTDVLAVLCLEDYILAGIGCTLHIYSRFSGELKETINATYPDKIHGITKGLCNRIAVYGAKTLCTYDFIIHNDTIQIAQLFETHRFMDWIISVNWLQKTNDVISVLFAHNNLYVFNVFEKHYKDVKCVERCILYGGSISGTCIEDLVIFSGTLFSETLIWTIRSCNEDSKTRASVLQRLKGHNGVISSVTYDAFTKTICCTSDDRTITLWKVKTTSKEHFINWKSVEITLTTTMYGHNDKVWRAVVRENIVVSIGQDSLICVWSTDGKLLNKIEAHPGACIWSIDITEDNNTIITGGGDGAIYQWPLEHNNVEVDIVLKYDKTRIPKHVGFLNSGTILIFIEGRMLLYRNKADDYPRQFINVPKYSSYCVMQLSPSREYVALASKDGFLNLHKEIIEGDDVQLKQIVEKKVMDSKIFSMRWLSNNTLLLCGVKGNLKIIEISSNEIVSQTEHILPPSRDCQITAAVMYKSLMICGDRAGSIYIFKTVESTLNCTKTACKSTYAREPVQTFPKIHGSLGVQSCAIIGTNLISAGRDGTLRFYELLKSDGDMSLRVLCEKRMPMDWVSNTLKTDTDTFVLGFKEVEFIIYSMVLRRILLRISCGGGHRSWDCKLANGCIKFIYIRDKQVYLVNRSLHSEFLPILQNGFHAKEIYSVQRLLSNSDHNIFISGGEDCTLRIFSMTESTSDNAICDFNTLDVLDGHISSVKSIAILNTKNTNMFSRNLIFSGGGRAQLRISEITVRLNREVLGSEDISCVQLMSHMLWGTDQQRRKSVQSQQYYVDPETRYMDISAYQDPVDKEQVFLFVACSDGYLRIFIYNIITDAILLGTSIRYNRCLLKVHSFTHREKIIVLTMATDGIINFWYLSPLLTQVVDNTYKNYLDNSQNITPFASFKLHQSGINSFDFKISTENVYLLTTGGDDNALNLIVVEVFNLPNGELSAKIISKWNSSSIHSTQITGLKFHGTNKLYSSGTDQKIISLVYSFDKQNLLVREQSTILTMIPDVQGLTLCNTNRNGDTLLCVYGKGFEMITDYSKVQ